MAKHYFRISRNQKDSGCFLPYSFTTKHEARKFLAEMLADYKGIATLGFKSQNRWATRDKIRVFAGSKEVTYTIEKLNHTIEKVEKNHE